ncbi:MAG: DUF1232 domain-containing protein [Phascolarctobacterium sp.]|nr:DUF1232 domain-containing protein [Phascolarctobacterium sp.]
MCKIKEFIASKEDINSFNENELWGLLQESAKSIGRELVYKTLQLWYVMQKPTLSIRYKAIIVGALLYLICPVDAIPDFVPLYGWSDDAMVIITAISAVVGEIDDKVNQKAEEKCNEIFSRFEKSGNLCA